MTNHQHFRSAAGGTAVHSVYRALIDTHLPFAEQRTVPTSNGEAFVLSSGPTDGSPALLLHGSGSVAASWGPELAELGRTHRVHAIDLPGESGLTTAPRLPLQRRSHARWLNDVASTLQAQPAAMIGVSLGSWVAIDYALTYPDAVSNLVLFSPSGIGPRKIGPVLLAALLGTLGDPGRRQALNYLLGPRRPAWTDPYHQDLGALALATFRHFRPRTDQIPTFTDDELRALPADLTVVLGERDRMLHGARAADRLRRLAVAGHINLLPGQGHLVPQSTYLQHLNDLGSTGHPEPYRPVPGDHTGRLPRHTLESDRTRNPTS